MKKILLIAVTLQSVMTFRRSLIAELQNNGYAVSVIAFENLCCNFIFLVVL